MFVEQNGSSDKYSVSLIPVAMLHTRALPGDAFFISGLSCFTECVKVNLASVTVLHMYTGLYPDVAC